MLSFGAAPLLMSMCNPTGVVRTQLKPDSPVMLVPLQLTTCVPPTNIVGSVVAAVGDITGTETQLARHPLLV